MFCRNSWQMQILNAGMLTILLHFYVALHYKIQILESSQMFVYGVGSTGYIAGG